MADVRLRADFILELTMTSGPSKYVTGQTISHDGRTGTIIAVTRLPASYRVTVRFKGWLTLTLILT
jgi:hypothetical protein